MGVARTEECLFLPAEGQYIELAPSSSMSSWLLLIPDPKPFQKKRSPYVKYDNQRNNRLIGLGI